MDSMISEVMAEGRPGDVVEVLARLRHSVPPDLLQVVTRFGPVVSGRVRRGMLDEVWRHPGVLSLKAPRFLAPPRPAGWEGHPPDATDTEPTPTAPSEATEESPGWPRGRGIALGILDWGYDFTHPLLIGPDGGSKFDAILIQGAEGHHRTDPYGYGRVVEKEELDAALRADRPFDSLGYHPDPDRRFRDGTHGTHVAAIASRIAPDAGLIGVHLSTGRLSGTSSIADSVRLVEGLDFVRRRANNRPISINLSAGSSAGSAHAGRSLVEQAMDAFLTAAPGRLISQSAGNYYSSATHASGRIRTGTTRTLGWIVEGHDDTPNELEIWYSNDDEIRARIVAPDDQVASVSFRGRNVEIRIDDEIVGRIYHRGNEPNTGLSHLDAFLYRNAPAGEWAVELNGQRVTDGRFHAWIERDSDPSSQSRFRDNDDDKRFTIGTIANGTFPLTVGAYNSHSSTKMLGEFSSRGPTTNGRIKPDLVAPGVEILSAQSADASADRSDGRMTRKSGTSMAAPHVAAVGALVFESAGRALTISEVSECILGSCDPPLSREGLPSERYGHGYLNDGGAVQSARNLAVSESPPSSARDDVTPTAPPDSREHAAASTADPSATVSTERPRSDDPAVPIGELGALRPDGTGETGEGPRLTGRVDRGPRTPTESGQSTIIAPRDVFASLAEGVKLRDLTGEMVGTQVRVIEDVQLVSGSGRGGVLKKGSLHLVIDWRPEARRAIISGGEVSQLLIEPHHPPVAGIRPYQIGSGLDGQRAAVERSIRELGRWDTRKPSSGPSRIRWERERARLKRLSDRKFRVYIRMWMATMMVNRFDEPISRWVSHYNKHLKPVAPLDPNIVKSIVYQESRMGMHGHHLMPAPWSWSDPHRHPIRSRFNLMQAIDSWGPQQWLMIREMAPALFAGLGLDSLAAAARWRGMTNQEFAAHPTFSSALPAFFSNRDALNRNFLGTRGRDLHEDYSFWIRTGVRWLFHKYQVQARHGATWAEAVRRYNGAGPRSYRYRDQVLKRASGSGRFQAELPD